MLINMRHRLTPCRRSHAATSRRSALPPSHRRSKLSAAADASHTPAGQKHGIRQGLLADCRSSVTRRRLIDDSGDEAALSQRTSLNRRRALGEFYPTAPSERDLPRDYIAKLLSYPLALGNPRCDVRLRLVRRDLFLSRRRLGRGRCGRLRLAQAFLCLVHADEHGRVSSCKGGRLLFGLRGGCVPLMT